jgi:mono/diheme cytochrome c family protein
MIDALYSFLASVGFNEPLHPPITHMPIGLVVGALVFFLVALLFKRKNLVMTARHVSILAFVFAFPTILLGVLDWVHFYKAAMITPIKIKMALAAVVLVVLAIGIIAGSGTKIRSVTMTIVYALAFVAAIGLGYFGAGLMYGRGVAPTASSGSPLSEGATRGQAVFAADCQSCHAGGGNVIVAELPLKGSKKLASRDVFASFIRNPVMPDGSAGSMPPFPADSLSDAQATDLYAYASAAWK